MLTEKQEDLSRCFATSSAERYEDFCHASYHVAATGAPIIDDTLAFIDARVVAEYPGGDHVIFLGQVEAMGIADQVVFACEAEGKRITVGEHGEQWDRDSSSCLLSRTLPSPLQQLSEAQPSCPGDISS